MATDEAAGPAPSPARRGASRPEKVDPERCATLLPPIRRNGAVKSDSETHGELLKDCRFRPMEGMEIWSEMQDEGKEPPLHPLPRIS